MGKAVGNEPCPRCRERGQDRRGDNLVIYSDDSGHCFNCGYHRPGKFQLTLINKKDKKDEDTKNLLPFDFQSHIPAAGWKWLLKYGLPYSYWQPYCGYSPSQNRIIFKYGEPVQYAQGRSLTVGAPKWLSYGSRHTYVETLGKNLSGPIVLVEDIISAHKVAQVTPCVPLFGTVIFDKILKELKEFNRPVKLWLDADQYQLLPPKINRLQSLLNVPVSYIQTRLDPKEYSTSDIKELVS